MATARAWTLVPTPMVSVEPTSTETVPSHSISAVLPAGSTVPSPPVKTISRLLYLLDEADSAAPDWSVSTPSQVAGADDPLAARVVRGDAGVEHDQMRLPAYGGALFDPDRYPFLEGRAAGTRWQDVPAQPLSISNRTVLHLLEALQFLEMRLPGGGTEPRRLSFRALDIEQIGHVYEGLLDHTARRAASTVLGLRTLDTDVIEAARLDGAHGWRMIRHIELPLATPALLTGLRNGFTLSLIHISEPTRPY